MSAQDTRQVVHQMLAALDRADWAALEAHPVALTAAARRVASSGGVGAP
jgi:hypothetical protein